MKSVLRTDSMPGYFTLKIADLVIGVEHNSKRIPDLCRDYKTIGKDPDINVFFNEENCRKEADATGHGMVSAEFACIYRQIAEELPRYSRSVIHGAAVTYKNKGYTAAALHEWSFTYTIIKFTYE